MNMKLTLSIRQLSIRHCVFFLCFKTAQLKNQHFSKEQQGTIVSMFKSQTKVYFIFPFFSYILSDILFMCFLVTCFSKTRRVQKDCYVTQKIPLSLNKIGQFQHLYLLLYIKHVCKKIGCTTNPLSRLLTKEKSV